MYSRERGREKGREKGRDGRGGGGGERERERERERREREMADWPYLLNCLSCLLQTRIHHGDTIKTGKGI